MTDNQTSVQTSVQQVDLDIDSWLGAPGADSIVTPAEGAKKEDPKNSYFRNSISIFENVSITLTLPQA